MYKFIIAILFATLLGSCSIFDALYKEGCKHVSLTWKKDEAKNIVDSLLINHKSTYFIINSDTTNYEYEFANNQYNIWILKIDNKFRIEVQKKDSLIYLYGK